MFEDEKALEFELRGRASLLSITPSVTQGCPASYPTPSTVPPRSPGTASMLPNPSFITAQAEKGTPGYQLGRSSLHGTISKADTKDHILVRMLLSFPTRPIRGPWPMNCEWNKRRHLDQNLYKPLFFTNFSLLCRQPSVLQLTHRGRETPMRNPYRSEPLNWCRPGQHGGSQGQPTDGADKIVPRHTFYTPAVFQ